MGRKWELRTKNGHDFYEVASVLQKSIRRNEPHLAGYFALELFHSGFQKYAWKRLLTISAEDCAGIITKEIKALHESWEYITKGEKKGTFKGRIFLSKAVLILCAAMKNRDSDHLQNLIYDKHNIPQEEIDEALANAETMEKPEIPSYAFDCHTKRGRMNGKTKDDFFCDELEALSPRQTGLFDNLV